MATTVEIELTSPVPASKLFKAYNDDFNHLAPKVVPTNYKSIEVIQGDGGAGTIKNVTFGDGIPYTSGKVKVDTVDATNHSVSYTIFEGDILMDQLDSANHHVQFVPSNDGGSVYKHKVVYNCKSGVKLAEDFIKQTKEGLEKTFKAIETHIKAN